MVGGLFGEFTWNFGNEFYIETEIGNFIWSDPAYHGDGSLRRTTDTFKKWLGDTPFGRSKGRHRIEDYCVHFVWEEA